MTDIETKSATAVACALAALVIGAWALAPSAAEERVQPQQPPPTTVPAQPLPAPPPLAPPAWPAVSAEGLVLYGVSGGGPAGMAALIGPASGTPRVVPLGKDYRPGLTLKSVGPAHAVLVSGGQETALHLGGGTSSSAIRSAEAPAVTPGAAASKDQIAGLDATALRLGMRPRREDGRITGFELRESRNLALLQRAGLQEGDVIVAVNGQAFESEEKLVELPKEIAGSYIAEFDVIRNRRRMKLSLPVNPQP